MKLQHTLLAIVALGASTVVASAQAPAQPGGPEGGGRRMNPIVAALDTDSDGVISSDELSKASESLKKLDKNNDGKLDREEFRPAGGRGGEGRGGEGRGGQRGGGEKKPQ